MQTTVEQLPVPYIGELRYCVNSPPLSIANVAICNYLKNLKVNFAKISGAVIFVFFRYDISGLKLISESSVYTAFIVKKPDNQSSLCIVNSDIDFC